jgi:hypothetical protein
MIGAGIHVAGAALALAVFLGTCPTSTVSTHSARPSVRPALFVSATGLDSGRCTRAEPCASFDRAYHVARPGQVVEVAPGKYPDQNVSSDPAKTSSTKVIFRPSLGAVVSTGAVNVDGARHVEFRGMVLNGANANEGSQDVTFRNITSTSLYITSAADIRVIGGSYGPDIDSDNGQIRAGCPTCPPSRNVLIDGALFHDAVLSPGSDAHVECLQVGDVDGLVIRSSRFVNCETHNVFISPWWSGTVRNVLLTNNFGGKVRTGYYGFRIAAGNETCDNISFRYNSATATFLIQCGKIVNGVSFIANVGPYVQWACYAGIVFLYNVWDAARCGPKDREAPSGFVDPEGFNLHLRRGSAAINRGDPADYPRRDIDGQRRPVGLRPDAGADESPFKRGAR